MYSYTIIQWLFFFYFYCFFGWCFESCYVSLKSRRWVNRGFMKGPFLPLYGSGAILLLVVSKPFIGHWWAVYIAGCIGATILEYFTGVTMEALFKVRYWDYSNQPFNFQGHICLGCTLAWGGLTLLMNYVIHKPVERLVFMIPGNVLTIVTLLLTCYIVWDFALSFKAALDLRDVLISMEKLKGEMQRIQKRAEVIAAIAGEDWAERKEAFAESAERKKEAFAESTERRKEAFAETVDQKKQAFAESMGQKKQAFADSVASIEKSFAAIKENLRLKSEQYSEEDRDEIMNLQTQYRINAEKHDSMRNNKTLSKIFKNNPTMKSKMYDEDLQELQKEGWLGKKKDREK